MERVRDNYNTQIQNLKDIRQYGSTQLSAVRGQYYEQVSDLHIMIIVKATLHS